MSFSSEAKNLEGRGLLEDDTGGENKASFSCYKVLPAKIEILLSITDQTKIYISLFTIQIKKEARGRLSVRVFLHRY